MRTAGERPAHAFQTEYRHDDDNFANDTALITLAGAKPLPQRVLPPPTGGKPPIPRS